MRDIWNRYHQFIGFVTAIVLCLLINLLAIKCTSDSYKDGQDKIIQSYNKSLATIDSLKRKNDDALNRILRERERTIKEIISDTAINKAQGLCPKQKEAVKKYIQPYLEVTTRELDVEEKIKANPNTEYQLMRDEIRNLLHLEFNKIQNEYETLEIWTGILTIVFLVFSFYSLFKSERFEEQSQTTANEINHLKDQADAKINRLDERGDAMLNRTEQRLENSRREIQGAVRRTIQEYQTAANSAKETFQQEVGRLHEQTDKSLSDMRNNISQMEQSFEQELDNHFQQIRNRQEQEFENHRQRLDSLINDAEALVDKLNEDTNRHNGDHAVSPEEL